MIKNYTKTPLPRRIFFWTLALSCVSMVFTVVFFSCGYRFNFSKNIFIQAGSVNVKSNPSTITAFIDGKKPKGRHFNFINNSYHITGIQYGIHDVKFSAEGYKDWEKKVRIHSGFATEFWNVVLVKNKYDNIKYSATNLENVFFAPKYELAAYVKKTDNKTLLIPILNTDKNLVESIIKDSYSKFDLTSKENIEWSPDTFTLAIPILRSSESIDIQTTSNDTNSSKKLSGNITHNKINLSKTVFFKEPKKDYLISERGDDFKIHSYYFSSLLPKYFFENNPNKIDIQEKLSSSLKYTSEINFDKKTKTVYPKISSLRFHPKKYSTVYAIINDDLYSINISKDIINTKRIKKLAKHILAYDITDDGIYALTNQGALLYDENYNLANPKTLTGFGDITKDTKHILIAYDKNRVLYLSKKTGALTIFNKDGKNITTKTVRSDVKSARFSNDGKKIIYNTTNSVYLYMTRDWEQLLRKEHTEYLITTTNQKINALEWLSDYEHVILGVDKKILLVDLDNRFTPLKTEIISNLSNNQVIIYNDRNNKLYFTNNSDKQLFSIFFPKENKGLFK